MRNPFEGNTRALKEKVIGISKKTQKEPDFIEVYWLNDSFSFTVRMSILLKS